MDEGLDGGVVRTGRAAERAAATRAREKVAAIHRMADVLILQTFRSYLQVTVRFASPVLLRALAREGVPLDVAVGRLRPPWGWPELAVLTHALRHAVADTYLSPDGRRHRARPGPKGRGRTIGDGPESFRATIRPAAHPDGLLEIGVRDGCLEIRMRLGPCTLTSRGGLGMLRVGGPLPETLADGCIGHPVERVVDHPLLRGQGWTIDRVDRSRSGGGSWTLVFATGQEPIVLPWGS